MLFVRKIIVIVLKVFKYTLYNITWYLSYFYPRNRNVWIFGAWFGDKYSDNAKVLFEYVCKYQPDVNAVWLTNNLQVKNMLDNSNKRCELISSLRGILLSLRAKYVIFSSSINDVNPFFINGSIIISTWHGAPMKKIGFDDKLHDNNKIMNLISKLACPFFSENLNGIVSTSEIFDHKLNSAFKLKNGNVFKTGYPRNDLLNSSSIHPIISNINIKYNNPFKVLYLPTFRSDCSFDPFGNNCFSEVAMLKVLEDNNIVLFSKGHFADKNIDKKMANDRLIHLKYDEIDELNFFMKDVDLLITDYSGAFFDFLLLEKPIILAPFDFDTYICKERELYFDYFNQISCGFVDYTWDDVLDSILKIKNNEYSIDLLKERNATFNSYYSSASSNKLFYEIKYLN